MQTLRVAVFSLCTALIATLFGAALAPGARADQWDRKTVVTFSDSVEIPGQVLPAGTYVFRLADSPTDRHIVQIWNADETQILATTMAIPNSRSERPDKSIFEFEERARSSPMALKVWFYPGDSTGQEFVYSRSSYSNRR
jgi:hypothetical protein